MNLQNYKQQKLLEKYFQISNFFETKNEDDFKEYKNRCEQENYNISNDYIKEIDRYYQKEKKDIETPISFKLKLIQKISVIFTIIFSVILSTNIVNSDSFNINIYLIISILIPFILLMYSFYQVFTYKYPSKYENSLLNTILQKILKKDTYKDKYSHILKIYTIKQFQLLSIVYILTISLSSATIFLVKDVNFHYESSFNISAQTEQKIVTFISFPWKWALPSAVPDIELLYASNSKNKDIKNTKHSNSSWAFFFLLSMI